MEPREGSKAPRCPLRAAARLPALARRTPRFARLDRAALGWWYDSRVRRSVLLKVAVYCPHFQRAVEATRNEAIDRLVACSDSDRCRSREPVAEGGAHE